MKADFKDGVSKAAGRLSSMATSVMSSIQVMNTRIIFISIGETSRYPNEIFL